jgi:hypothetical protein
MAVSGIIKSGDVYILISGRTVVGRMHIPSNCMQNCNAPDCDCNKVRFIQEYQLKGKLVDITSCQGSLMMCINRLESVR